MARSQIITEGRRLNDLGLALAESIHEAGGCDEDIRRVLGDKLLKERLGRLVMGKLKFELTPSETYAADLIPAGCTVVEDVEPTEGDVEFVTFLEDGKGYVGGDVMRQRAKERKANLGLADAKRLLEGDQAALKGAPRDKLLVFAGTVLRDSDGSLRVASLYWNVDRWFLSWDWIAHGWSGLFRLARRK